MDLLRLDLTEWLARAAAGAAHAEVPAQRIGTEVEPAGTPENRSPAPEQVDGRSSSRW
ncbi:hypothetical protein MUY14_31045 [Amycolatopsis sp. FBCC-B4732]|uniref:hypothetical protein n=1 Tax=Amycolatopsis sp. FBCC-B4732 TaxID=3079339 RepID=UPI001FF61346|nr:hypothetical protein [Amycolatopsis sp. FBCC-B4732]UOX86176.1 hypothetical protein MUY14_31045 [Amycolatopsis sp. FBCC-B4732]